MIWQRAEISKLYSPPPKHTLLLWFCWNLPMFLEEILKKINFDQKTDRSRVRQMNGRNAIRKASWSFIPIPHSWDGLFLLPDLLGGSSGGIVVGQQRTCCLEHGLLRVLLHWRLHYPTIQNTSVWRERRAALFFPCYLFLTDLLPLHHIKLHSFSIANTS